MNDFLLNLEPKKIWYYFREILAIPRPSKKEEKIREYLIDFAKKHGLEHKTDATGNILITKNATKGYENKPIVVLQSHIDIVCEKNADKVFDFEKDGIEAEIKDGWLVAKGTTLGGDNGIGVAMELALLASEDIEHGKIECLFTVDEETGLTGAFGLEPGFFTGKILLNLDSEDDGQFFMGCAGGIDTTVKLKYAVEEISNDFVVYQLDVKGLKGGHSGDDINRGRENALKLLNRILHHGIEAFGLKISDFKGGNLRNAIPREASAIVAVPKQNAEYFEKFVEKFYAEVKNELLSTEPDVVVQSAKCKVQNTVLTDKDALNLIRVISACPHGVVRMASDVPNFVETSTNLASIKMTDGIIEIATSQRSSIESRKYEIACQVADVFQLAGATVKHGDGYPGWKPNPSSPILKVAMDCYEKLFRKKGQALAIHAGLECGLFSEKYPGLDMVSYGPTMRGVHSPDECLEIKTVEKFWKLTLEILKSL
ncbi:MAG: aminoacyl-histidine dipeptidase [Bacteroidales bacterium]|jgi:dipeptidase D|nr:aminoacyl-histidine dipeptidase [Bacteroidales bacterium]